MFNEGRWYALQVRPFSEHISESILAAKGYETFLPTYTRKSGIRRQKNRELALFPGYMFCRIVSYPSGKILTTPGVIRVVGAGKQPIPVPDREIEDVRIVTRSWLPHQPWRALAEGSYVRIESGPMRTLQGILVASQARRKLVITVTILQRSVAVELDANTVVSLVRGGGTHEQV